jgi:hypothetical protein
MAHDSIHGYPKAVKHATTYATKITRDVIGNPECAFPEMKAVVVPRKSAGTRRWSLGTAGRMIRRMLKSHRTRAIIASCERVPLHRPVAFLHCRAANAHSPGEI